MEKTVQMYEGKAKKVFATDDAGDEAAAAPEEAVPVPAVRRSLDFDALGAPDRGILHEMASCGHKPLLMKALERIFT